MKNPLTLEAFAEWLEQQPQDMEYDYCRPDECAVGQFLHSQGFAHSDVLELSQRFAGRNWRPWNGIAQGNPRTFGAAARRARSLLARDTSLGMRAEDVS